MAGYVRQDVSNNISNGSVVDADDLDNEFNAIVGAFNASTGHTHDGSAAEGAPITVVGPGQELSVTASGAIPKTNDTYDLGSSVSQWKDLYIDGVANIDSLVADTADINGGTADSMVIGGVTPAAGTFTSITASSADINGGTVDGTTIGGSVPAAGTFTSITASSADINGGAIDGAVIGGSVPAAGSFTTLTTTGTVDINAGTIDGTTVGTAVAAAGRFTTLTATGAVDINSGNIDGTVIGAASPSTGAFTNISATGNITVTGTVDGRDVAIDGAKLDTITLANLVTLTGTEVLTNKSLTSPTLTGAVDVDGSYRSNVTAVAALDIDCSLGNYFTKSLSANSTFTFSNVPSSVVYGFTLKLVLTGTVATTWPASVQWANDEVPIYLADSTNLIMFITDDGGTTWRGASLLGYGA